MLIIFLRALILLVTLIVALRLMGKRQLSELQPFEFAIMLVVAELACIPMQDFTIPVLYGVVAIIVVLCAHYILTLISNKSLKFRKLLSGKPVIVINEKGIDAEALKVTNLSVHDILECIRGQGYFSLAEIKFGIFETNGKLSIMPNDTVEKPRSIPLTLIVEGRIIDDNIANYDIEKEKIRTFLTAKNLKEKDILLMTAESKKYFVQAYGKASFTEQYE